MEPKACKSDVSIRNLAEVLEKRYGSTPSDLDQGYPIYSADDIESINARVDGRGDDCLSFREVMNEAVRLATKECLSTCSSDHELVRILAKNHNVKLPWIFYEKADGTSFDSQRWKKAVDISEDIGNGAVRDGFKVDTPEYSRELGRRIFEKAAPPKLIEGKSFDRKMAVWGLYSAMLAAGLDVSFVSLPVDAQGNPTPYHVALSIKIDDESSVIADPVHRRYDLKETPAVPITFMQALAMYEGHMAMRGEDSLTHLERSLEFDPTNKQTWFYWAHANANPIDPLKPFRYFYGKGLR